VTASTSVDQPTPDESDSAKLLEMCSSTEPWTTAQIAEFFGVSRNVVWHWARASRNYQFHGATTWPPTQVELRLAYGGATPAAEPRDWWPPHPTILPPVDLPGDGGRDRWLKGTIVKWARKTKRVDQAGNPAALKAGTRGRGRPVERAPTTTK